MITIGVSHNLPNPSEIARHFTRLRNKQARQIGHDMVQQVRRNIRTHGDPSGDWPPLSGFNVVKTLSGLGVRTKEQQKTLTAQLRREKMIRATRKLGVLTQAQTTAVRGAKHSGYARRKAEGKTPGRGKFGPGVRLRDTEAMAESLEALLIVDGQDFIVRLNAKGNDSTGTSNNDKLRWHATGAGRNPVRDPTAANDLFEAKARAHIEAALAEPIPSSK